MADSKQLLEAAARAAGYKDFEHMTLSGGSPALYIREAHLGIWAPLTDDGDALRLLIALRLETYTGYGDMGEPEQYVGYSASGQRIRYVSEPHGDDPTAATRLAITRAAAACDPHQKGEGNG